MTTATATATMTPAIELLARQSRKQPFATLAIAVIGDSKAEALEQITNLIPAARLNGFVEFDLRNIKTEYTKNVWFC
jgi:hypothetical protein